MGSMIEELRGVAVLYETLSVLGEISERVRGSGNS